MSLSVLGAFHTSFYIILAGTDISFYSCGDDSGDVLSRSQSIVGGWVVDPNPNLSDILRVTSEVGPGALWRTRWDWPGPESMSRISGGFLFCFVLCKCVCKSRVSKL